jgi:hypothetical protein
MIRRWFWLRAARMSEWVRTASKRLEQRSLLQLAGPDLPPLDPARVALRDAWSPIRRATAPNAGTLASYIMRFADAPPAPDTVALARFVAELARDDDIEDPAATRLLRLVMPPAYAPGACAVAARSFVRFWTDEELLFVLRRLFPDVANRLDLAPWP